MWYASSAGDTGRGFEDTGTCSIETGVTGRLEVHATGAKRSNYI